MNDTTITMLAKSPLFAGVNIEALTELVAKSAIMEIDQDDVLFYQGSPSDSAYLVLEGKLLVELTTYSGESRIIGHIDVGQTVGELGALTNEVRSLTVKALRRTHLLRIPAKDLIDICHRFPAVMFSVLHPMVTRSRDLLKLMSAEKTGRHILVVPANEKINVDAFLKDINEMELGARGIVILSDFQPAFSNYMASSEDVKESIRAIKEKYTSIKRTLYILKSHDTPLARYAFKKANKIYVVADATTKPQLDKHVEDKLKSRHLKLSADPSLILIHPPHTVQPTGTAKWLSLYTFGIHHHVRLHNNKDYARLIRFMCDRAVGVVLSGGGTRGWAHLGVLKALKEKKIPIDIIGGTSVGAVISACYAMRQDYDDAYDRFYHIIVESYGTVSWRSLTWPIVSLFNAKKYTQSHRDAFGDATMEDLWIPCFGISCNLATNREHIHRTGKIWEIIRASTSIPGLIPPMLFNGEIHFDGGLLNNLPVDVMRSLIGKKARIIAAELNSFIASPEAYDFPPVLPIWKTMMAKFGWGSDKYKFPRLVDIFMQGLFVGSLARAQQNSLIANTFVSLDLSKFSLLKSNPDQARQLVEIGYKETLIQLSKNDA